MAHLAKLVCVLGIIVGFTGVFFASTKWLFVCVFFAAVIGTFFLPPTFGRQLKSKQTVQTNLTFWQSPFPYLGLLLLLFVLLNV